MHEAVNLCEWSRCTRPESITHTHVRTGARATLNTDQMMTDTEPEPATVTHYSWSNHQLLHIKTEHR